MKINKKRPGLAYLKTLLDPNNTELCILQTAFLMSFTKVYFFLKMGVSRPLFSSLWSFEFKSG